jgi:signal transduction histidine kinase
MVSALRRYSAAALLTVIALALALWGEHTRGGAAPYSLLLAAVMISSWIGGLGPGILSTVLGTAVADYFTIAPLNGPMFDISRLAQMSAFVGLSILVSSLNGSRRRALAAVNHERAQLEARVAERTAELASTNADLQSSQQEQQLLLHELGERVKELTALTLVGRLLNERGSPIELLSRAVAQLPAAWQYPDIADARIVAGSIDVRTAHFQPTPWMQRAEFHVSNGCLGAVEIVYREARPDAGAGPFLPEERRLIDSLAGLLQAYFERVHAEAQAEEARRQAHEANAAKDQFLATVSHELRSPLSVMLGWTQMLRSGQMSGETVARGFDVLERSVRLQAKLIEDLLDVSRIITGRLNIEKRPVDLVAIAGAAIEEARPAARTKHVKMTAAMVPELVLDADPQRLQQVISNQLTNALKFTPEHGAIELRVEPAGSHALIVVHDTGIGIAPDVLPRIFNRFEQGDSSTTRRYGGLGLGLAIVKYFVEQHGGQVCAMSEGPGRGSTFTISLPLLAASTHQSATPDPPSLRFR